MPSTDQVSGRWSRALWVSGYECRPPTLHAGRVLRQEPRAVVVVQASRLQGVGDQVSSLRPQASGLMNVAARRGGRMERVTCDL